MKGGWVPATPFTPARDPNSMHPSEKIQQSFFLEQEVGGTPPPGRPEGEEGDHPFAESMRGVPLMGVMQCKRPELIRAQIEPV